MIQEETWTKNINIEKEAEEESYKILTRNSYEEKLFRDRETREYSSSSHFKSLSPRVWKERALFSPCFSMVFGFSHTLTDTKSVPPSTEELHSYATPFSTHSTTPRAKDTKWMNRKKWVKEKQIFNRVKKEYENERKETNRNSYRRIAKCGVCAMRRDEEKETVKKRKQIRRCQRREELRTAADLARNEKLMTKRETAFRLEESP